jgi:hypothetical protein
VPGRKGPIPVDADQLMRDHVLKNQIVFGTVNASAEDFKRAISDISAFNDRWPNAPRGIISHRIPLEHAIDPLSGKIGGIKNVISIGAG